MIRMGLVDKRWGLTPRDREVPAWKDAPDKEWQERRMEVYAAQIDRMDQNVGTILDALRASGQEENTLILFLADNGGCAEDLAPGNCTYSVPEADARRPARATGQRARTHARRRRTRSRVTAPAGPTRPTRPSASTSTGCTRAASRRR